MAEMPVPGDAAAAWQPLKRPVFRGLWAASASGHFANWMQQVGAAALMATLTPSPMMTALVQTAASLPSVLLGLPAGAAADLFERRRWLMFTQCWLMASAALATGLLLADAVSPLGLLGLTLLLGTGFALQAPASQAVIGEVVPRAEVPAALALGSLGFNVSRILGPALAGVLIGLAGGRAVYATVALCYVVALWLVWRWEGARRHGSLPPEDLLSALRSGVRFVRHTPQCLRTLQLSSVFMICGSGTWALLPLVARDLYGTGAGGYGLMMGAFGVGGVLSIIVLPAVRGRWPAHRTVAGSALGFGLVTLALAGAWPLALVLPALALGGVAWALASNTLYTVVQLALPDWVRARGVSINNLVYFFGMAGGAVLWGGVSSLFGLRWALALIALAMAATALWCRQRVIELGHHEPGPDALPDASLAGLDGLCACMEADEGEMVLVQHVYRVRTEDAAAFLQAAEAAGLAIKRNGARFWRLYRDLQQPGTFVERYAVDSLRELRRQQSRLTPDDQERRRRVRDFLVPGSAPTVHYFAAQRLP